MLSPPSSAPGPKRSGPPPSDRGLGLLAALAVGLCCGLPLLVSAGVVAAAGGFLGHPVVIGAGLALALAGLASWRTRRSRGCRFEAPADKERHPERRG